MLIAPWKILECSGQNSINVRQTPEAKAFNERGIFTRGACLSIKREI